MWVRLATSKIVSVGGRRTTYQPGDWVEVGKHDALQWIAAGEATAPSTQSGQLLAGCTIVVRGSPQSPIKTHLPLGHVCGEPRIVGDRMLFLDRGCTLRSALIPVGFALLDNWEVAVPLENYETTADRLGTEGDRAIAVRVMRDLRVLVYDSNAIFARNCKAVLELLDIWDQYRFEMDERLAFLIALYVAKPYVLALPTQWTH